MLFTFSLVLGLSTEILSSVVVMRIHLMCIHLTYAHSACTFLELFLSNLITSSSITGQVSLSHYIGLHAYAEYNLPFATEGKSLLAMKGTKSLKLLHPLVMFVIAISTAHPLAPIVSPR